MTASDMRAMVPQALAGADVVAAARAWIGTPYRHQASCHGAGADCLGLIRGVWRDLYGTEPETPPPYTPDWAERQGEETLGLAAGRHMKPVAPDAAQPGDLLLFRMRRSGPAKHAAILSAEDRMIHAYSGHAVCVTPLGPWWRQRLAFAFRFPGVI